MGLPRYLCPFCLGTYENKEDYESCAAECLHYEEYHTMPKPTCFGTQPVPSSDLYSSRRCGFCDVNTSCMGLTLGKLNEGVSEAQLWLGNLLDGYTVDPSLLVIKNMGNRFTFKDGSQVEWNSHTLGWKVVNAKAYDGPIPTTPLPSGPNEGTKHDGDKLRWSLLPDGVISKVIAVLEFGAKKYAVDNWKKVEDHERRYYDATMRHIEAWKMKEPNDPESGLPHLAHAVCNLLFLLWFEMYGETKGADKV